jgi:hypothetical protein
MTYENQSYEETAPPPLPEKASGMAIAALVLGILGLPCCCGCLTGVPALIVGFIENGKINRGESSSKGKGFAITGIILGLISLLGLCVETIWIAFFGGLNVLQQFANR